jgi:hypothetical protein
MIDPRYWFPKMRSDLYFVRLCGICCLMCLLLLLEACPSGPSKDKTQLLTDALYIGDSVSISDLGIMDTVFVYKGIRIFPVIYNAQLDDPKAGFSVLATSAGKTDTMYSGRISGYDISVHFSFEDFNGDHHPDVSIFFLNSYMSELSDEKLFLFNQENNRFEELDDFADYQQSEVLDSASGLRYSFQFSGCIDRVWTSALFAVKDRTITPYGRLWYEGCDSVVYYKFRPVNGPEIKKEMRFRNQEEKEDFNDREWLYDFWKQVLKSGKVRRG